MNYHYNQLGTSRIYETMFSIFYNDSSLMNYHYNQLGTSRIYETMFSIFYNVNKYMKS
jgi:hypothetical protein